MSGTSLDGLDLVCCNFILEGEKASYEVVASREIPYEKNWKDKLDTAFHLQKEDLVHLDKEYGRYLGEQTKLFIAENLLKPAFVASHGHTVFHRPEKKISLQIGNGNEIAKHCGVLTVNNFRMADVLKGGQGAPLVPIGDKLLFGDYELCLNIGGISNVSFDLGGKRLAYDIAPANMVLNYLASKAGFEYDPDGRIAASGRVHLPLCEALDQLAFFAQPFPKSLGREWVEQEYMPVISRFSISTADLLASCTHQIGSQIGKAANMLPQGKMLITGGGAFNKTLLRNIGSHCHHQIVVPDKATVKLKEAIVFAFLGLRRLRGELNCLASVTGASSDSSSGDIWVPDRNAALNNN